MTTKRKSPKRVAAGKKAARTRRRNTGKSRTTTTTTRRTYSRSRRSGLSEMTSAASMKAAGSMILASAGGAAIADQISRAMPNQTKLQRVGLLAGLSYVAATALNMPHVAAGMAAVAGLEFFRADDTSATTTSMTEQGVAYISENDLNRLPDVVSMSQGVPLLQQNVPLLSQDYGVYGQYDEYGMQYPGYAYSQSM